MNKLLAFTIGLCLVGTAAACAPQVESSNVATPGQAAPDKASQPTTAVSEQTSPQPEPGPERSIAQVGDIIEGSNFKAGVAGGKRFEVDGREYLGVKLYFQALSDDTWMSLGEAPFRLVDSRGVSVETDPEALFRKGWDYLDPSKASKAGTSTAGWLAYPLDEDVNDDMKLVVVSEEVSLEGLLDAPGDSKAAKAYAELMKERAVAEDARSVMMDEYRQIRDGMTYEQVRKIIGFDGTKISGSGSIVVRSWLNADASSAWVTFEDGRVTAKAQAGL